MICSARLSLVLCAVFLLFACGPKEIGQGSSSDAPFTPEATAADVLRQPVTGMTNIQKWLFWQNKPEVMMTMQKLQMETYRRRMGLAPSPENPEYRAIPKQRSPFRQ